MASLEDDDTGNFENTNMIRVVDSDFELVLVASAPASNATLSLQDMAAIKLLDFHHGFVVDRDEKLPAKLIYRHVHIRTFVEGAVIE